jgi:hypothetical protein
MAKGKVFYSQRKLYKNTFSIYSRRIPEILSHEGATLGRSLLSAEEYWPLSAIYDE